MWKILVVDDDDLNRNLLVEILGDRAACTEASGGREAVAAFCAAMEEKTPFDLILLDIAMPEVDGIDALDQIRKAEEARGILLGNGVPVIMVTAHANPFMKSFRAGCDDYILKPLKAGALLQKIDKMIRRQAG